MSELERAESLLDLDRPGDAERLLRSFLREDPQSAEALWLLTLALNRQGRYEEAVASGRSALALEPQATPIRITLTDSLIETERVEEAREVALGSVRLDPHDWRCHYSHAQALMSGRLPRYRDALAGANVAVRLAPNSPDVHNLAGLCLDHLGMDDEARKAYRTALELDPGHAQAMNNLATLDMGMFRLKRATKGFTSALSVSPGEETFQDNLGLLVGRLTFRLFLAILGAALVIGILLGTTDSRLVRASFGLVLISLCGWLAWSSRRHLPGGMSRNWRTLFTAQRMLGRIRLLLTALAFLCVCFMAFAPATTAIAFAIALATFVRIAVLMSIGGAVLGAIATLARRR